MARLVADVVVDADIETHRPPGRDRFDGDGVLLSIIDGQSLLLEEQSTGLAWFARTTDSSARARFNLIEIEDNLLRSHQAPAGVCAKTCHCMDCCGEC